MKNKHSNIGKILCLIAFSIYAIMVSITKFETPLEKGSSFNLIAMNDAPLGDDNSGNDNPTDSNQLTNLDVEDTSDYWILKIFFEFKVPKQLISNSLSYNYKEPYQLQFQIDIVSPPPQV